MHAISHSISHRAPSATRTRVRWQPYNPLSATSSTISTRSPSSAQSNSPSTSFSSPPSNTPESKFSHPQRLTKETPPPRDTNKKQFALNLVDQTVKTLGEIWRPQDIPAAFRTTPISENAAAASSPRSSLSDADVRNGVPIKGYVHEIIRRSRTSGCVLQTALCYLEAIRPKIPHIRYKEQSGQGRSEFSDISSRITPATQAELEMEEEYRQQEESCTETLVEPPVVDLIATVRLSDDSGSQFASDPLPATPQPADGSAHSIAPLPSPLLCPRRAFLASLILASKFTLDKCYSNRAWAKLSGLPAREISRCEHALGEALEWRLWVGKSPIATSSASNSPAPSPSVNRSVARSQSEGHIVSTPTTRSPFLVRADNYSPSMLRNARVLQRSSTVPVEMFVKPGFSSIAQESTVLPCHQPHSHPAVTAIYADSLNQSPSPDVPGLTYSPSSTESSSGDRTIQMASFDELSSIPSTTMDFLPEVASSKPQSLPGVRHPVMIRDSSLQNYEEPPFQMAASIQAASFHSILGYSQSGDYFDSGLNRLIPPLAQ